MLLYCCRAVPAVRQQSLPRGVSTLQFVWSQPHWTQPEACSSLQESNPVRPALCGRGAHGVLGLHAAAALLQATELGLRSSTAQELYYAYLPAATSSMLWWVPHLWSLTILAFRYLWGYLSDFKVHLKTWESLAILGWHHREYRDAINNTLKNIKYRCHL